MKAHLFICTHTRTTGESCGAKGSTEFRDRVKSACKADAAARGAGKVHRVNSAGCLDRCKEGIAAVLYPSGQWFTELKSDEASEAKLVQAVAEASRT